METRSPARPTEPFMVWIERRSYLQLSLGLGLLAALAFIAYWPSLGGGFLWDDLVLVSKNPLVTGDLNLRTVWFAGDFSLTTVATWVEWKLFGDHVMGYRLVNLVLHVANSFLAWRFLAGLKIPAAWLGAALFAVHPVAVASVAWVSELKNTLSLAFFLAAARAFLAFDDELKAGRSAKARLSYTLSLVAFTLALLAKTSTVALPVVLLAAMWWRDRSVRWQRLLQLWPHFGLALIFGLLTVWFQSQQAIRGIAVQSEDFWGRLAGAGYAFWFYLGKAILPVNLCMIYGRWIPETPSLTAWLPTLMGAMLLPLAWRFRNGRGRFILFAYACFVAALFPVLGFFDMYFMIISRVSDHLAYLSLPVVTATAAAGIGLLPGKAATRILGVALLTVLVVLSRERAKVFSSDEALWRDTVARNPLAWNAHNNLACNLAERGDVKTAIQHFARSLELNPENAQAHRNLANALMLGGQFTEAEPHFLAALKLKPDDTETLAAYARGLVATRQTTRAIAQLRKAVGIKPDARFRLDLAPLLAATGDFGGAAEQLDRVLEDQPNTLEALNNLAWIRATCPEPSIRNGPAAVRLAKEACRVSGGKQPVSFGTLAAAYAEAGDFTNAVHAAQTAIDLATAAGNQAFANQNKQLLQRYESGRPFHMPQPNQRNP